DSGNRSIDDRLKLFEGGGVGTSALKREPRARERRSHGVSDIVAASGKRMAPRFHLVEHAVDDDRELRKRLVDGAIRKPLAQIAGDDALNPLVDLFDAPLRPPAQPRAGKQAKTKTRQQAQRHRQADDMGNLVGFVDFASHYQDIAIWHAPCDGAD